AGTLAAARLLSGAERADRRVTRGRRHAHRRPAPGPASAPPSRLLTAGSVLPGAGVVELRRRRARARTGVEHVQGRRGPPHRRHRTITAPPPPAPLGRHPALGHPPRPPAPHRL